MFGVYHHKISSIAVNWITVVMEDGPPTLIRTSNQKVYLTVQPTYIRVPNRHADVENPSCLSQSQEFQITVQFH